MLEEYFLPALIIVFLAGFLIGLNLGMICSRSVDTQSSIPAYALRRENLPVRYPGTNQHYQQHQQWNNIQDTKRRLHINGINEMTFK